MTEPRVAVVLTALDLEYKAVRQHLTDLRLERLDSGTHFEIGTVQGTSCRVVIGLTEAGNSSAAVLAERAIQRYAPVVLLFSGVAGALRDSTDLGDVVVGSHVYAYHSASGEDDGLKARPREWPLDHGVSQTAHHVGRSGSWAERLPAGSGSPKVKFGSIAAGDVVQKSRISREAKWIREHYNDAVAIEMEGAGIAQAGHLNSVPVGVIRGISDRADGGKTVANDATWQPRAAECAAAFAVELAVTLINGDREREPVMGGSAASGTSRESALFSGEGAGATVINVATGTVGIQGQHVSGNTVRVNSGPRGNPDRDLVAVVTELRTLLRDHHQAGGVDEDTYEAAAMELDNAEALLPAQDPASRRKLVLALKKFGAVMSEVAVITAGVAAAVSLAQGLS